MMGVYIKGMEMPKEGCHHTICIYADGRVSTGGREYTAIPVPPHGDLIDRKPFVEFIKTHWDSYDQWFVDQLEARPTVITADTAEEGE